MRTLLKLAVVALLANGVWHVFNAYAPLYKFKDSVEYTTLHRDRMSDDELAARVLEIAAQFDLPVTADNVTVGHQGSFIVIDVSYVQRVDILPGYGYPLPMSMHASVMGQLVGLGPK